MITLRYRTLMVFAAGFAVALIALFALQAWRAEAAPGDSDATLVPITPCRLLDTRPDSQVGPRSTPIGEDSPVTFTAWDSGDDDSKCEIPTSATAISTNTTIAGPTASSWMSLYPADQDWPGSSNLNYVAGQAPTPNAVTTPLSATGQFNVLNRFGTVHVIVDVNGYYTNSSLQALAAENAALRADVATMQSDVAALQALTASISTLTIDGQPTVRFTGVNVQIVDGSSDTYGAINGKGNLIVGYNENESDTRTGSHNLIVGFSHSYSGYGGFVAGSNNTISGNASSVSGGSSNTASNTWASVTGGFGNTASGNVYASVSGGFSNTASGTGASVAAGDKNSASGDYASVTGGQLNTASGDYASVSGGFSNTATTSHESVAGGDDVVCTSSLSKDNFFCGEGSPDPID